MDKKKSIFRAVRRVFATLYFLFFFSLLFTTTASAYIDPATLAMLTQIFAGIFITLGVVFGVFRSKITLFFSNLRIKMKQRKIERQVSKQGREDSDS